MNKTLTAIALATIICAPLASAQETYKCKTSNGVVYQDRPCTGVRYVPEAAPLPTPASSAPETKPIAAPASDLERNKLYLSSREKERKIGDLKEQIVRLEESITQSQQARDAEIGALQARQARANNNLAGANLEQALATEMQSVNARYTTDIGIKQDRLKQLRDELAKVK